MLNWIHTTITTDEHLSAMVDNFNSQLNMITASAFDTETTGLSHVRDLPFLYQFGWYCEDTGNGYTYAVDLELHHDLAMRTITVWNILRASSPIDAGQNVKYDLHMQINIGLPYWGTNITDTTIWMRLGSDAIPERKGGTPLALKKFATRYISSSAADHEHELDLERSEITKTYNDSLQSMLNKVGAPPKEWGYKSWTKGCLKDFFKDKTNELEDLPVEFQSAYKEWHNSLPEYLQLKVTGFVDKDMIRYDTLNRETLTTYGHYDIVWTLEALRMLMPIVKLRGNLEAVRMEEACIYPVLRMERIGFEVNRDYVLNAKIKTKEYLRQRRTDLARMAGQSLNVSQSKTIMQILQNKYNVAVTTTNADELDILVSNLKREGNHESVIEFISIIQELRTLEKWYSTYIVRFLYELQFSTRIYTTVNTTGTVSGRVTSDFQQFPKDSLNTVTGEELFCPRRMVVTKPGYRGIVYLDYSQIELRLQAFYTILVGHADLNLCRAYMPYKCHTWIGEEAHQQKKLFDHNDKWCLKHSYDYVWYLDEDPDTVWHATDVHGATTKAAFDIVEDDEQYGALRYVGKRVNFAKNYGAQRAKISTMFPEYSEEQITRIDSAYYIAFPGVKMYHNYCYTMANRNAYMTNLFGVRYYGASGHNLINMLVQGTGAYFLKWKINQVDKYLIDNKCKSKLCMQIHDEIQIDWHPDDSPKIFFEIKKLMEEWDDTMVPIVADVELTTTTWKDKYNAESIEVFYES